MQYTFDKEKSKQVKGFAILLLLAYHLFEQEAAFGNVCVSVFVFLTGNYLFPESVLYYISRRIMYYKKLSA